MPREGGVCKRLREVDPTASLRDFVELGDIWIPERDPSHDRVRQAVDSGERFGQVPLFLYDKMEADKKYGKTLRDMVFQEYVRLARSEDLDSEWEHFAGRWCAAGGEAMTRERPVIPRREQATHVQLSCDDSVEWHGSLPW